MTTLETIIRQQENQNERLQIIIDSIRDGNTPINATIKDLENQLRINIELTSKLSK